MDLSYVFFDTLPTGTAVLDALLFQVARGGDATHTEDFTNGVGAGSFPQGQKMVVDKVGVLLEPAVTPADMDALMHASIFQIIINSQVQFWAPLALVVDNSAWNGFNNLAAAAGLQVTGMINDGYELKNPIVIEGGVNFSARIKTTVATAVTSKLVVVLYGTYTRQ